MKSVIILRGAPGAGKSSLARLLQRLGGPGLVSVLSADFFMDQWPGPWSVEKLQKAHTQCKADFGEALKQEVPVIIIDNTNTKTADFMWYLSVGRAAGYDVRCVVVENRHAGRSVRNVPEATVEKYRARIRENVQP
jgi:predicted kinase